MKGKSKKPRHAYPLERGWYVLIKMTREKCLRVAIDEGVCGIPQNASFDEAEQLLRRGAKEGWDDCKIHGWVAPEGFGGFISKKDGAVYFFMI